MKCKKLRLKETMSGHMMQQLHLYMTSSDAQELAKKLEEREQSAKLGESLEAKRWYCDGGGKLVVVFHVDQERAKKNGLMR